MELLFALNCEFLLTRSDTYLLPKIISLIYTTRINSVNLEKLKIPIRLKGPWTAVFYFSSSCRPYWLSVVTCCTYILCKLFFTQKLIKVNDFKYNFCNFTNSYPFGIKLVFWNHNKCLYIFGPNIEHLPQDLHFSRMLRGHPAHLCTLQELQ